MWRVVDPRVRGTISCPDPTTDELRRTFRRYRLLAVVLGALVVFALATTTQRTWYGTMLAVALVLAVALRAAHAAGRLQERTAATLVHPDADPGERFHRDLY